MNRHGCIIINTSNICMTTASTCVFSFATVFHSQWTIFINRINVWTTQIDRWHAACQDASTIAPDGSICQRHERSVSSWLRRNLLLSHIDWGGVEERWRGRGEASVWISFYFLAGVDVRWRWRDVTRDLLIGLWTHWQHWCRGATVPDRSF